MTIEQKALKAWGETSDPAMAIWILKDGTLVNGCMGGCLRDVDHAEIGQFFKPSKFQDPGSNWIYIRKFIRRGNIRMCLSTHEAFFELSGIPTQPQWRSMGRCFAAARRLDLGITIEKMGNVPGTGRSYTKAQYMEHLMRYAPDRIF